MITRGLDYSTSNLQGLVVYDLYARMHCVLLALHEEKCLKHADRGTGVVGQLKRCI